MRLMLQARVVACAFGSLSAGLSPGQVCQPSVIGPVNSTELSPTAAASDGTLAAVDYGRGVLLLDFDSNPPTETFVPVTEGVAWVEVSGDTVYVVSNGTFIVYDASDRTTLTEIGSVSDPLLTGFFAGSHADANGRVLLCDLSAGLVWVDASDPTTPAVIGRAPVLSAHSVDVVGDYAFVSSNNVGGIAVIDISSPEAFAEVASTPLPGAGTVHGIALAGDAALVCGSGVLSVVDISNPLVPQPIGNVPFAQSSVFESVIVSGDRGFLVDFDFPVPVEVPLIALDLSDPLAPAEVGRTSVSAAFSRSVLVGDTLVVPSGEAQTTLVDVSDCLPGPCIADTNGDGELTPADFNAWIVAFNNGDAACDQNGDGLCTPADFNGWILNFNAGC